MRVCGGSGGFRLAVGHLEGERDEVGERERKRQGELLM